jgi:CRISPR/Cas system CSM-associated protein Csm3 (group 7 of RAMP superfamily)
MAPLREDRITWKGSAGSVAEKVLLLPGSAIKGALSHRVAFHHNLRSGDDHFANHLACGCKNDAAGHQDAQAKLLPVTGGHNAAVCELFGFVDESNADDRHDQAARGRVLIDDLFWCAPRPLQQHIPHVSIDRFTGGAADSKLFSERPLWQGDFPELKLNLLNAHRVSHKTRQALKAALEDLTCGRLALGAGAGRGLGYFDPKPGDKPPIECSAGDDWFNQGPQTSNAPSHAQT